MKNVNFTRRNFLKGTGCAGVANSTLFSGLMQLGAMTSASAQTKNASGYKALVCVLLAGGADSFNMLVPTDSQGYQEYAATRSDLALPQSQLLPLNSATSGGKTLGLHPAMTELQGLYNSGNLAFISNVGTLVEPTSPAAYQSGNAKLPLGLHSHSDQISQWQTAVPDQRSATGWGGRLADLLRDVNSNDRISMSISTSGSNEFQAGKFTDAYSVVTEGTGTVDLFEYQESEQIEQLRSQSVDSIFANQYQNLFRRAYLDTYQKSIAANAEFANAISSVPNFTTQFGADEFSKQIQMVARTIAANQSLNMTRQTFFVTFGGWDHHDNTLPAMASMVPALSQGLAAFQSAMNEIGMSQNVTTFTTSDFGRTLSSNGKGSDHGWGGNQMVIGGAVQGGKIYGDYPSLALNNPLDTGRGVLIPTLSVDNYFAELALWFGVSQSQLTDVLPNIGRFHDVTKNQAPIGFLV